MTTALAEAPAAPAAGRQEFCECVPGVYEDVTAELYHAMDAASASRLNLLRRSPLHAYHAMLHPEDFDTDAKALGSAGHACLLEPAEFAKRYALGPDVKLNTKAGKEDWEAFVDANPGKTHVRGADGQKLVAMHRAVWAHPAASRYLSETGRHELSLLWQDRKSAALCKARLDRYVSRGAIFDIKTTRDASPEAFARSMHTYGYHRQAALYLRGAQTNGLDARAFLIIAVENEPPHAVAVYAVDDTAIQQGDRELTPLLEQWCRCMSTGKWPGYSNEAEYLHLPKWARDEEAGF